MGLLGIVSLKLGGGGRFEENSFGDFFAFNQAQMRGPTERSKTASVLRSVCMVY